MILYMVHDIINSENAKNDKIAVFNVDDERKYVMVIYYIN
jgi:hypothetical protein